MLQNCILFGVGALGYGALEILFRGNTHWTMLLTGGFCLIGLRLLSLWLAHWPLLARCAAGSGFITLVELAVGLLCNRCFHLCVWDYSGLWGNLWGQICPLFSLLWFLLCIPLFWAFARVQALGWR